MKKLNYLKVYSGLPKEIYILFIARIITCMGMFILPLWTLILTQKIGLSKPQTGFLTTVFAMTQIPCLLFGGKLIDTFGRKRVIFISQVIGAIIYISCAFIGINRLTIVLIMITTDFYVVASPALDAMIADITKPDNRKASFSLIYLGLNIGFTISPLLGGLLFQHYLPILFVLDGVTTLISTSLIMIYVKEPDFKQSKIDQCEKNTETDKKTPVLKILFNVRVLFYFMLIMFVFQFCYSQWSFTLPLQMADLFKNNGARNYSFLVAVNSFSVIVLTPLATVLTRKFRSLTITAVGGLCYFIAFVMFGLISNMPLFLAAALVLTIGEIIITVNINTFVADHTPHTHRGRINSLNSIVQGTCYAIAPLIMGNVISKTSYFTAWSFIAALMFLGALGMFALDRKEHMKAIKDKEGNIKCAEY